MLFDNVNFESTEYEKWVAYGQSKTANVLFTVGLDKRLASSDQSSSTLLGGVARYCRFLLA